jgi:hypothetical protein
METIMINGCFDSRFLVPPLRGSRHCANGQFSLIRPYAKISIKVCIRGAVMST